ncbi:MAG: winged helix-turn-helix domain-containing protein [Candidatus Marsarchaeota archaeon]|nr:winged helix-turn-helix domain-containing protein [Candidatus Marsarchaeota archaeon]MCL5115122.1 winged helix-turn-helix domain-containing protein [Candidatus Marsarchaeota archaeon]
MSKTWGTKKRILKILSQKQMNVSEISGELGLSVSTTSQHLSELNRIGAIREVENPFIKKWKYYRTNENFDSRQLIKGVNMPNMYKIALGVIAALVIVGGVAAFALYSNTQSNLVLSLTDPPQVPSGTTALTVSYSSLQAHLINGINGSAWINVSGSGALNLMSLVNVSQVIGAAKVPNNAIINQIRFDITSAQITVNGTTYNVTVPNSQIIAELRSRAVINSSTNILVDLSPTVATIYTANSTIFVLVPSVKAVVVSGAAANANLGTRRNLNDTEKAQLQLETPNIQITSASLSQDNNTAMINVTVKNNANQSIAIKHITISGNFGVEVAPLRFNLTGRVGIDHTQDQDIPISAIDSIIDSNAGSNVKMDTGISSQSDLLTNSDMQQHTGIIAQSTAKTGNSTANSSVGTGIGAAIRGSIGVSGGLSMHNRFRVESVDGIEVKLGNTNNSTAASNASTNASINALLHVGLTVKSLRTLNFIVSQNGTLVLPQTGENFEGEGYMLQPNSTATFTFLAPIVYAQGHIRITLVPNSTYNVVVQGEDGARISENVTAS